MAELWTSCLKFDTKCRIVLPSHSDVKEGLLATKDYYEWWLKISRDYFFIGTKTLAETVDPNSCLLQKQHSLQNNRSTFKLKLPRGKRGSLKIVPATIITQWRD